MVGRSTNTIHSGSQIWIELVDAAGNDVLSVELQEVPKLLANRWALGVVVRAATSQYDGHSLDGAVVELSMAGTPQIIPFVPMARIAVAHTTMNTFNIPSLMHHLLHGLQTDPVIVIPTVQDVAVTFTGTTPTIEDNHLVTILSKAYGAAMRQTNACITFVGPACGSSPHTASTVHHALSGYSGVTPAIASRATVCHAALSCFLHTLNGGVLGPQRFAYHFTVSGEPCFSMAALITDNTPLVTPFSTIPTPLMSLPHVLVAVIGMDRPTLEAVLPEKAMSTLAAALPLFYHREAKQGTGTTLLDTHPLLYPFAHASPDTATMEAAAVWETMQLAFPGMVPVVASAMAAVALLITMQTRIQSSTAHISPPSFKAAARAVAALIDAPAAAVLRFLTDRDRVAPHSPTGSDDVGYVSGVGRMEMVKRLGDLAAGVYSATMLWLVDQSNARSAVDSPVTGSIYIVEPPPMVAPPHPNRAALLSNIAHEMSLAHLSAGAGAGQVLADLGHLQGQPATVIHSNGAQLSYPVVDVSPLGPGPRAMDALLCASGGVGEGARMLVDLRSVSAPDAIKTCMVGLEPMSSCHGIYLSSAAKIDSLTDFYSTEHMISALQIDVRPPTFGDSAPTPPSLLDRFRVGSPDGSLSLRDLTLRLKTEFSGSPTSDGHPSVRSPLANPSPTLDSTPLPLRNIMYSQSIPAAGSARPGSARSSTSTPRSAHRHSQSLLSTLEASGSLGPPAPAPTRSTRKTQAQAWRRPPTPTTYPTLSPLPSPPAATHTPDVIDAAATRLYKGAEARRERLAGLKERVIKAEDEKIRSDAVRAQSAGRSRASGSGSGSGSFIDRVAGYADEKKRKLDALRRDKEDAEAASTTFKPTINSKSAAIAANMPAETERLHSWGTARERKIGQMRERFVEDELAQVTGKPQLSTRTQRLASNRARRLGLGSLSPADRMMAQQKERDRVIQARREEEEEKARRARVVPASRVLGRGEARDGGQPAQPVPVPISVPDHHPRVPKVRPVPMSPPVDPAHSRSGSTQPRGVPSAGDARSSFKSIMNQLRGLDI